MKILVMSDSHGRLGNMQKVAYDVMPDCIFHLGDSELGIDYLNSFFEIPTYGVRGNCDMDLSLKSHDVVEVGKHRFFLTHGHSYRVNSGLDKLKAAAKEENCDVALFGHTHVPLFENDKDLIVANPGSIECPRQKDHQFSYMVISINEGDKMEIKQKFI